MSNRVSIGPRNVLGWSDATHGESESSAGRVVIAPLACALINEVGNVQLTAGSRLAAALFQPERAALKRRPAPLVTAFALACSGASTCFATFERTACWRHRRQIGAQSVVSQQSEERRGEHARITVTSSHDRRSRPSERLPTLESRAHADVLLAAMAIVARESASEKRQIFDRINGINRMVRGGVESLDQSMSSAVQASTFFESC
jgi:hypothetical protein